MLRSSLLISLLIHAAIFGALVLRFHAATEVASGGANVAVELGAPPASAPKHAEAPRAVPAEGIAPAQAPAPAQGSGTATHIAAPSAGSGGTLSIGPSDPYYAHVRERVESHLRYPASFARRRIGGKLVLELTLDPRGAIAALSLAESSGNSELDQWALDSVKNSAPFEAFQGTAPRVLKLPISFSTR